MESQPQNPPMESQPQNPQIRNNPENFYPCTCRVIFQCFSRQIYFSRTFHERGCFSTSLYIKHFLLRKGDILLISL